MNIEYYVNQSGKEPEFLMKIGFDAIENILLSISQREPSNRGSGSVWDTETKSWARIVDRKKYSNAYEENKEYTRIYHDTYEGHIKRLGLDNLRGLREKGLDFVIISNGNLGNNCWHVAWQYDEEKKLYCLKKEPFLERSYSCFIVPRDKTKKPFIGKVQFNEAEDLLDETGKNISDEINWCTYGQQIVRTVNGSTETVPIEEIIEQFADVRHVFDLKDWRKDKDSEEEKVKVERNLEIISEFYESYPEKFREKMLSKLKELPRAKYYHSTLGLDDKGVMLYHYYDKIEEIAKRLVGKGVKDSIILDQGGSVGVYASWRNSFLSTSSYFRPNRISVIGFVVK